jgi:hypothetical protein
VAGQWQNVAFMREKQNDTASAVSPLRESLAIYAAIRPATDNSVLAVQRWLAQDLCTTGAAAEGDSIARVALSNAPTDSTQSMPHRLRSVRGYCLTQQTAFADAEPLLLAAERGLRDLPAATASQRSQVVEWLARLYQQWGKPEEAAVWASRRDGTP